MKKYMLTAALTAVQMAIMAQTVNVHFKNGQTIEYPVAKVDYVDFSAKAADPSVTSGQAIDLGLSVYWASCNLGAEAPEEYGDYYAWGETKTKNEFGERNYAYYDTSTRQYIDIGDDISGTEYDAATVNLGSDWQMPSRDEMKELIDNCTWEWTQIKGINGYRVIGQNGNSIFLPASGCSYRPGNSGLYYHGGESSFVGGDSEGKPVLMKERQFKVSGFTIRPVTSNPNAGGEPSDHSKDYLVTEKVTALFTGGAITKIGEKILSGSVLNTQFTNNSTEPVTLLAIQVYDAGATNWGNNALDTSVEVTAGEWKTYGVTLVTSMAKPVVRFTYRYNFKKYHVESIWEEKASF